MITSPPSSKLSATWPAKLPSKLAAALCLSVASGLMPITTQAKDLEADKQVTVLGRSWVVAPTEEVPGFYSATRLNTELRPKRPPAVLSARQAVRAFHRATGCSANLDTLYRDITGTYFSALICPHQ
ncbi:MAG: hypothetical protein BM558_06100 [Roseobacter sp. MedPE-SW]|nr:MAG: hypothetical protein BM558_06100 [Roseobacter sp. MedPE-SW]